MEDKNEKVLLKNGSVVPKRLSRAELRQRFHISMKRSEIAFVSYAMRSHQALVEKGLSITSEPTIATEEATGRKIIRKIIDEGEKLTLTKAELQFIELAVREHNDFCETGDAVPWKGKSDVVMADNVLKKLLLFYDGDNIGDVYLLDDTELEDKDPGRIVFPVYLIGKAMDVSDTFFRYDLRIGNRICKSEVKTKDRPINGQIGLKTVFGYSDPEFIVE